mmetsp:Transcript_17254/g.51820  ORF Transcript_17254/g.51820 Transcript_17254/m.51820 type:complete len:225 (+) Transcript_17254:680-1354(+)
MNSRHEARTSCGCKSTCDSGTPGHAAAERMSTCPLSAELMSVKPSAAPLLLSFETNCMTAESMAAKAFELSAPSGRTAVKAERTDAADSRALFAIAGTSTFAPHVRGVLFRSIVNSSANRSFILLMRVSAPSRTCPSTRSQAAFDRSFARLLLSASESPKPATAASTLCVATLAASPASACKRCHKFGGQASKSAMHDPDSDAARVRRAAAIAEATCSSRTLMM